MLVSPRRKKALMTIIGEKVLIPVIKPSLKYSRVLSKKFFCTIVEAIKTIIDVPPIKAVAALE